MSTFCGKLFYFVGCFFLINSSSISFYLIGHKNTNFFLFSVFLMALFSLFLYLHYFSIFIKI